MLIGLMPRLVAQESYYQATSSQATLFLTGQEMHQLQTLSSAQLQAFVNLLDSTPTVSPNALPNGGLAGNYYSLQNPNWPPLPGDINQQHAWKMKNGGWLLSDLNFNYRATHKHSKLSTGSGSSGTTLSFVPYTFDTNKLYLQITQVTNGLASLNLNNATNQVYAIWEATNILAGWQVATEIWPTNPTVMPVTIPTSTNQNLYFRAEDWTGVTENGNTTPDWWFWENFGTTALSDTNLDGQGNTLLYDYQNGLNPDIINFTVRLGSQSYNTMSATGSFLPLSGVPAFETVLVNSTNFAAAPWTNYDGLVHLPLGPTDGAYQVWLGLKGPAPGAPPTWLNTTVYLNRVAPAIVLTSPTSHSSTTAVPYVQLQGYAAKTLQSVTYDLSNALTMVTGQSGILGGHFVDTNLQSITTNFFHCYDLPLTNGPNLLTLHATDISGNTTVTNVLVTLDYTTATNPVLKLTWPKNGMQLCGSSFTLRGLVDDPTAIVTATITDTNGDTNVITGNVERTGVLWAENLPLNSGTNWITLCVTNAAGLASSTNFSVFKSGMTLALTSINGDLWLPTVDVSGVISDPTYNVCVNGVRGTNNGDGTWNAYSVPVSSSGVASFDMSANLGGADPDASTNIYKPAEILIQSAVWNLNSLSFMGEEGGWQTNSIAGNYTDVVGGTEEDDLVFENLAMIPTGYEDDLEFIGTNQVVYNDYLMTGLGDAWYGEDYPADINQVEGALQGSSPTGVSREWSQSSQVRMALYTGGKATIQTLNLFQLSATATEELAPAPTSRAIAANNITVAGQTVGADGNLYTTYPNGGEPVDVTPQVGAPMYSFTINQQKFRVFIQVGDSAPLQPDHVVSAANFSIGQSMPFSPLWRPYTPGYTNATAGWWLPGSFVNDQPYDYCPTAYDEDALLLNANLATDGTLSTPCWYVDQLLPGTATLKMSLSFANGQTVNLSQTGQYNVYKPTFAFTNDTSATVTVGNSADCGSSSLMVGTISGAEAMAFHLYVQSQFPGDVIDTQLINSWWSGLLNTTSLNVSGGTGGAYCLDGAFNSDDKTLKISPDGTFYYGLCSFLDEPCTTLTIYQLFSRDDQFKTYFLFRPSGSSSIYVPLGIVNWNWFGNATEVVTPPTWDWTLTSGGITGPTFAPTDEFPVWQNTY